jgi:hypothetical protein
MFNRWCSLTDLIHGIASMAPELTRYMARGKEIAALIKRLVARRATQLRTSL